MELRDRLSIPHGNRPRVVGHPEPPQPVDRRLEKVARNWNTGSLVGSSQRGKIGPTGVSVNGGDEPDTAGRIHRQIPARVQPEALDGAIHVDMRVVMKVQLGDDVLGKGDQFRNIVLKHHRKAPVVSHQSFRGADPERPVPRGDDLPGRRKRETRDLVIVETIEAV
jgi:hypothetical protein